MASVRAPLELGGPVRSSDVFDLPLWARRLPRGLVLALASVLIPGHASRWL